jgi:hypothetical protein
VNTSDACLHQAGAAARTRIARYRLQAETSSRVRLAGSAAQMQGTQQPAPPVALETTSSTRVTRIAPPPTRAR